MSSSGDNQEAVLLRTAIARLRASVMAVTFGLTAGSGLFLATVWLLIRGGEVVGPNLSLLSNYFPGYSVTWLGACVGFVYGLAAGAVVGWCMARLYNLIADR